MCLSKISISNPISNDHLSGFDKPVIKVACGKCPECRKQKSQDWIFRTFWELKDNINNVFFVTLTYDDLHLPYYNGKPVFNHFHVRDFLDRLRHSKFGKFSYLLVSEYGGLFSRPHYHLIVIPKKQLSQLDAYWFIRDCWWYGDMLDVATLNSVKGQMLKAASYVTQYVNKDPLFDLDEYEKDFPSHYKCRLFCSAGYGKDFFKYMTKDVLLRGFYYLPVGKNGENVKFRIPRYYEMKKCYDYSYHKDLQKVELKKNDLGLELAIFRHNGKYVYYKNLLNSSFVNLIHSTAGEKYGFTSFPAFARYVVSQREFYRYLYVRDFISDSFDVISQTKFDPVFKDFYCSSSALDLEFSRSVNGKYFYTFNSDKPEFLKNFTLFEDFYNVIEEYQDKVDLDISNELRQKYFNLGRKRLYNKLRSRPSLMKKYLNYQKSRFDISLDKNNQYSFTFNC